MSTTTIRIPDELKARVAAVAERVGVVSQLYFAGNSGENAARRVAP